MASSPQKNLQFISPPKEAGDFLQNQVKSGLFGHYPKEKNKETEKETSSSTPSKNG